MTNISLLSLNSSNMLKNHQNDQNIPKISKMTKISAKPKKWPKYPNFFSQALLIARFKSGISTSQILRSESMNTGPSFAQFMAKLGKMLYTYSWKTELGFRPYPINKIKILKIESITEKVIVGPKDLGTPAHFISSPRFMKRRKKCPRMDKGNPDCQDILLRTTLSSVDQNHGRGKHHVARGRPFEHPKGSSEPNGPTIGAW